MLAAIVGTGSDDPEARRRSLDAVVAAYWKPIYKYVRVRWRCADEDAEDLTQGFFERAANRDTFAAFDPKKARFRTFLRHCLDQHVINELKAASRLKRGGARRWSIDFSAAEAEIQRIDLERHDAIEDYFDREWYRSVLAAAIAELRERCAQSGKQEHFAIFERYDLAEDEPPTYAVLAAELGSTSATISNRLNYARSELRRIALEILSTVTATEEELDAEARLLFGGR